MEFVDMETAVVEVLRMPEIQRLRRVRQLGLAHLVFPGAEHSRLVHSIGAAHLAIRFVKQLIESSQDYLPENLRPGDSAVRDIALAALCHDMGHGPLSHMWEREVIGDFDRKAWCNEANIKYEDAFAKLHWHEFVGQILLGWTDGPLHRFLEQLEEGTSERIRKLLLGVHYIPYLPMLLDNDVDVDRADFIFRDAKETGVLYGRYDLNWLISSMVVGETNGKLVVGFDERKAPRVVEQFLIARRALYDTVYYHKTVQSAEAMMGLLLRRLKAVIADGATELVESPTFASYRKAIAGKPMRPPEILELDDYGLWTMISELVNTRVDKTLADLAQRIVNRDLFKAVSCDSDRIKAFFNDEGNSERLRSAVSAFTTGEPAFYYSHTVTEIRLLKKEVEKRAFFVETRGASRKATVATDTETFLGHVALAKEQHWLFVPSEARDAVTKLVLKG